MWKHASCKFLRFGRLYYFGLDEKQILPQILRLNWWTLYYFGKLGLRQVDEIFATTNVETKLVDFKVSLASAESDGKLFKYEY